MSTTKTTVRTHYISMGGSHGCLPDNCNAYHFEEHAVDAMTELYELSDEQVEELKATGSVELTSEQGGEYCEVSACTCERPWEHSEDDSEDEWPDYSDKVRVSCDQCQMLSINGVACHEIGCPNMNARWDVEDEMWIRQYKCFTCGCMADAGSNCCSDDDYNETADNE